MEIPNLILAAGHYRNGILLGPLTGQLVTDLVLGQSPAPYLSTFRPARFALRVSFSLTPDKSDAAAGLGDPRRHLPAAP